MVGLVELFVRRDVLDGVSRGSQPIKDDRGQAVGGHLAKGFRRIATEVDALEEFVLRELDIHVLERAENAANGLGRHLRWRERIGFQVELDVLADCNIAIAFHPLHQILVTMTTNEIVGQIENVLLHVYLLSEISRSHDWISVSPMIRGVSDGGL